MCEAAKNGEDYTDLNLVTTSLDDIVSVSLPGSLFLASFSVKYNPRLKTTQKSTL